MIAPVKLFSTDPGKITDFSKHRVADIFNNSILPAVNSFLGGGDVKAELGQEPQQVVQFDPSIYSQGNQDPFFKAVIPNMPVQAVEKPQEAPDTVDVGHIAPNLTEFVKGFEGFKPNPYGDNKQTSIGWGTRSKPGETVISREDADQRLSEELDASKQRVLEHAQKHGYDFTDNELDALTSFDYNTGKINQLTAGGTRDKATIAEKMLEYRLAGGKVLPGLVKRRAYEQRLFLQGYGNPTP